MPRIVTPLSMSLLAFLTAPVVAFGTYDLLAFQPHRAEMHALLEGADPAERNPPESLRKVLHTAHSPAQVGSHVSRLLLAKLGPKEGGTLLLHIRGMLWYALVNLHFSEAEREALFLALSPMGEGHFGYAAASPSINGVALHSVSVEQAARLVTISKSPSGYLANPERLVQSASRLAERAENAP